MYTLNGVHFTGILIIFLLFKVPSDNLSEQNSRKPVNNLHSIHESIQMLLSNYNMLCVVNREDFFLILMNIHSSYNQLGQCSFDTECNLTTWGEDCGLTCSSQCLDKDCHAVTGMCKKCIPGYYGDWCDKGRSCEPF